MNEAHFRILFFEHKDAVFRFAWRMTGSIATAEDVTQDCFLAFYRAPEKYQSGRGALRYFLIGVARNLILKCWRAENRFQSLEEDTCLAEPIDAAALETRDLVAKAVSSLPPLQREALILHEYEGMSLEEVARLVDTELTAVKARLHRARENLRRTLAPLRNRREICNL